MDTEDASTETQAIAQVIARTGHNHACADNAVQDVLENDELNAYTGAVAADYTRPLWDLVDQAADLTATSCNCRYED